MTTRYVPLRDGTFGWGSRFGPRGGGQHRGVDFEAVDGTPIYAAGSGVVAHIGAAQGFGQWIVIRHDSGESTVYGHMWDAHALDLRAGARVFAGEHIAFVGSNGESTGPHLHFEVHPGAWAQGSQIDPRPWLNGARNPGGGNVSGWTGDAVWLADVVRPAVDKFVEYPGWRQRGHGDFKDIRGVMVHHTGGRAAARSIAEGRPDLPGPLSQFHIAQDGTVTVVAVGVAWHAGVGSYPWLPANMGNWHMIGIECEGPVTGVTPATQHRERWPDAQVIALRNLCAAILLKLQYGSDRLIGHKDYAGRAQGKWDPWNMDVTGWLAGEVDKDMRGFVFPGENGPRPVPPVTPPPTPAPLPPVDQYAGVLLYRGMRGAAVRKLQERLKAVIVSELVVDGDFGPKTEAAVRAFQSSRYRRPPLVADGIVGPATAAQLRLVL